jgi:hypothetical protein
MNVSILGLLNQGITKIRELEKKKTAFFSMNYEIGRLCIKFHTTWEAVSHP